MQTPGVYIDEINGFPNSVVPAATAIPAFIGYTPRADYEGKSYANKPVKISSYQEFEAFFCLPNPAPPADRTKQYTPSYYAVESKDNATDDAIVSINGKMYHAFPDPGTVYYLMNSVSAFFQNGGGTAYIVSIGNYGAPTGKPAEQAHHIVNPNVQLSDLLRGLEKLKEFSEITMYICPEATLLPVDDNGTLMETMLAQCEEMQTAMSILDIIGANAPDPILYTDYIQTFRNSTGTNGLKYGASYYPFLKTTIMRNFDYGNFYGGDIDQLKALISPTDAPNHQFDHVVDLIKKGELSGSQADASLINASNAYKAFRKLAENAANVLPPSGFMAGIYTTVDNSDGVWKAPANVTPIGASGLTININEAQQENLNVDAVSGKSVNCIRHFNGLGILVWGARTLDGNSQDWRYISVRRTITFIEQSCKNACRSYVFQPNDKNTWESVKAMLNSFLTGLWKEGALMGSKASDAFSVQVGLGSTMTSDDIANGYMNIAIQLALIHPAEFIVITFQQEVAQEG
ncbi:MAG: hypothetical protein Crog4KO_20510 [Crocinitomicaceae bacterium]